MAASFNRVGAVHESGSKFYEIITIGGGDAKSNIFGIEIRRWGKIAQQNGGGESDVKFHGDVFAAQVSGTSQWNKKVKGGYKNAYPNQTSVQSVLNEFVDGRFKAEELLVSAPFKNLLGSAKSLEIRSKFVDHFSVKTATVSAADLVDKKPIPKAPEPVRADDWGSW